MTAFWYRPDGRPATRQEAQHLLSDAGLRLLAQDTLHADGDIVVISTWFTVFDHAPPDYGRPLLWETVVSDGRMHTDIAHYSTREQASRGHADAVMLIGHRLRELSTSPSTPADRPRQAVPVPEPRPQAHPQSHPQPLPRRRSRPEARPEPRPVPRPERTVARPEPRPVPRPLTRTAPEPAAGPPLRWSGVN